MRDNFSLADFKEAASVVGSHYEILNESDSEDLIDSIDNKFLVFRSTGIFQVQNPTRVYDKSLSFHHSEFMKNEFIYLIYDPGLVHGAAVIKLNDGRGLSQIENERHGVFNCFFTNQNIEYLVCSNDYGFSYVGDAAWVDHAAKNYGLAAVVW